MKTIGIYPGQFQPPTKAHFKAYEKLRHIAGPDTFVITTDYDPIPEAALNFGDKEQILVRHGVDASRIKKVENLNKPWEVLENFDSERTVLIYALNQVEADKKIKTSKYYQRLEAVQGEHKPFKYAAYILVVNDSVIDGKIFSTKNIREALGSHRFTNDQKIKWFKKFFGWFDLGLFELLKNKYTNAHQTDSIEAGPIKEELTKEIRKILGELLGLPSSTTSTDASDIGQDDMKSDAEKRREANKQKQDLVKQKQQTERDLKSAESDLKWKKNSVLTLRKDTLPGKRKELDNLNKQITQTVANPPTMGT